MKTYFIVRCDTRVTVGVTSPCLLKKKLLPELIQPVEQRVESVKNFISEVRIVYFKNTFSF